jgi:hypothetical protein
MNGAYSVDSVTDCLLLFHGQEGREMHYLVQRFILMISIKHTHEYGRREKRPSPRSRHLFTWYGLIV